MGLNTESTENSICLSTPLTSLKTQSSQSHISQTPLFPYPPTETRNPKPETIIHMRTQIERVIFFISTIQPPNDPTNQPYKTIDKIYILINYKKENGRKNVKMKSGGRTLKAPCCMCLKGGTGCEQTKIKTFVYSSVQLVLAEDGGVLC